MRCRLSMRCVLGSSGSMAWLTKFRMKCPHCEMAYAKHHQLRTHIASSHSPPGTKPFKCTHENCTWSFPTSQKLKVHQKTHGGDRYMCSHDVHGDEGMVFPNWSALRAHVKMEHPPTCPFEACNVGSLGVGRGYRLILSACRVACLRVRRI
jgi:general transcription factor IIIA